MWSAVRFAQNHLQRPSTPFLSSSTGLYWWSPVTKVGWWRSWLQHCVVMNIRSAVTHSHQPPGNRGWNVTRTIRPPKARAGIERRQRMALPLQASRYAPWERALNTQQREHSYIGRYGYTTLQYRLLKLKEQRSWKKQEDFGRTRSNWKVMEVASINWHCSCQFDNKKMADAQPNNLITHHRSKGTAS